MTRVGLFLAMLAVLAALAFFFSVSSEAGAEQSFRQSINAARDNRGLNHLELGDGLQAQAENLAGRMAAQGHIFHDPCEGCSEIVGVVPVGCDAQCMFGYFMDSDDHRAVILGEAERVGCGHVAANDLHWWACDFRS